MGQFFGYIQYCTHTFTSTVARVGKFHQNEESMNEKTGTKRCEKRQTSHSHRKGVTGGYNIENILEKLNWRE